MTLIRCWFTQSWDTRKQGCKPQRQSNACSASFCISKAQRGHPVLRSKTCVLLPINQSITSFQPFHIEKKKDKKRHMNYFRERCLWIPWLFLPVRPGPVQVSTGWAPWPGSEALRAECPLPSGNPGPSCSRISGFLQGFVCLLLEKEYKLFFRDFIPVVKRISWPP